MRDVNKGWLIRYLHANGASMFFILVYLHIARGLYYGSYTSPRILLWSVGVVIFFLMMGIAFIGYTRSLKWSDLIIKRQLRLIGVKGSSYNPTSDPEWDPKLQPKDYRKDHLKTFFEEKDLEPVYHYEKLYLEDTKKQISKDTNGLSGVYMIFNKITGDYYIGSASTGRFYARFYNHLYNQKGSKIVKHAVKKYGLSNFAFVILDLFPEVVTKESNKDLLDLEDYYLKTLLPNYNILTEAGSSFGYKHTEITRLKIKTNYSSTRHEIIGNRGQKLSPIEKH